MDRTFDADDLVAAQTHPRPEHRQAAWSATVSLMLLASLRAERNRTSFDDEWRAVFDPATLATDSELDSELGATARDAASDLAHLSSVAEPRAPTADERVWATTTREHMRASIDEWRRANS